MDEMDCPCGDHQLPLPKSACLDATLFCNGVRDAAGGLDEESCSKSPALDLIFFLQFVILISSCSMDDEKYHYAVPNELRFVKKKLSACKDRLRRTDPTKICDAQVDCPDSSDETSCGKSLRFSSLRKNSFSIYTSDCFALRFFPKKTLLIE